MPATNRPKSDYTMMSRRWRDEKLVSAEVAINLARAVHMNLFGQADLDANEPLSAQASGDVWVVRGAKHVELNAFLKAPDGPMVMRISQYDGQIVSYYFEMPDAK